MLKKQILFSYAFSSTLVIIIIGVIVGVVVVVLIIIAIVCCLKDKKVEKPAQTSEMELTERPNGAGNEFDAMVCFKVHPFMSERFCATQQIFHGF